MGGKQLAEDANMKQAVTSWLQAPDTIFFYATTHDLMHWGKIFKWLWCAVYNWLALWYANI